MTERAIENWLTKTSERGYQTAFCHLLNAMGFIVVHSTTHGPSEEGKDVIALDPNRRPVAFQLKKGNITVNTWRMIKAEVEELVEYPINHPSIPSGRTHRSVLVTTGYINENASSRINAAKQNWINSGWPELEVWAGSQLLAHFKNKTGSFLPQPIPEFHRLLGLMIAEGKGLLNKDEFHLLLQSVLPIGPELCESSKTAIGRNIAAAAVIVEYAMAGVETCDNHFAKVEAYTMLACYIWACSSRFKLPRKMWQPTIALLETAVDRYVALIAEEAVEFIRLEHTDPSTEPVVGPYRAAIVGGVLAAHGLWCLLRGNSEWFESRKDDLAGIVEHCLKMSKLPSEYFVAHIFLMSEFLRHYGRIRLGQHYFLSLLSESVMQKQAEATSPLWDPYVQPEDAVFRHLDSKMKESAKDVWENLSYTAWPLILIAARRGCRQFLAQHWHAITSIQFHEPLPHRQYQRLLWRFTGGTMQMNMVPRPSSWRRLCSEATKKGNAPGHLRTFGYWLPYYLLVYPHRFNKGVVLALEDALSSV